MKKFLLTGLAIISLIAINIQAQPRAENAIFRIQEDREIRDDLRPYVKEGHPPYTFSIYPGGGGLYHTPNMSVSFIPSGEFEVTVDRNGTYSFQYTVTDATGQTSQPATITVIVGPEKG